MNFIQIGKTLRFTRTFDVSVTAVSGAFTLYVNGSAGASATVGSLTNQQVVVTVSTTGTAKDDVLQLRGTWSVTTASGTTTYADESPEQIAALSGANLPSVTSAGKVAATIAAGDSAAMTLTSAERIRLAAGDLDIPTSGLVALYRSDIGLTSIASRVSGWTDQSGNGNDATQSTSTKRMLRDFADPTSLWAEYNATASPSLDVPSSVSHSTQAVSIFMVVAPMLTTPVTGGLPGVPMTNWYANLYTGNSLGFNAFYGIFSGTVTGPGLLRGGDASDRVDSGMKLLTSPQVVGIVGTSSNVRFHVGDQTATATGVVSGGALPSATVNGGTIGAGGAVATTGPFAGEYLAVVIYNRAVTTTESDQIIAALSKQFAVPVKGRRIVLEGDSIALCTGAGGWLDYVKGIEGIEKANCAIPTGSFTGTTWVYQAQNWPNYNLSTYASGRIDVYRDTQAECVLCVHVGTNDLVAGVTPADAFAALQTYCTARRAAGWRKIIVAGLTARTNIPWANVSAFNALLRAAYNDGTAEFDIFADTELDPLLCSEGADLNTEIFFDGTHFAPGGKHRMAAFMQPYIAQAFGTAALGYTAPDNEGISRVVGYLPATGPLPSAQDVAEAGLTAQQVRDAMKLAPTAGSAENGSLDYKVDHIDVTADVDEASLAAQIVDLLDGANVEVNGPAYSIGSKSYIDIVAGDELTDGNSISLSRNWTGTSLNGKTAQLRFLPMDKYNVRATAAGEADLVLEATISQTGNTVSMTWTGTSDETADLSTTPTAQPNYMAQAVAILDTDHEVTLRFFYTTVRRPILE